MIRRNFNASIMIFALMLLVGFSCSRLTSKKDGRNALTQEATGESQGEGASTEESDTDPEVESSSTPGLPLAPVRPARLLRTKSQYKGAVAKVLNLKQSDLDAVFDQVSTNLPSSTDVNPSTVHESFLTSLARLAATGCSIKYATFMAGDDIAQKLDEVANNVFIDDAKRNAAMATVAKLIETIPLTSRSNRYLLGCTYLVSTKGFL